MTAVFPLISTPIALPADSHAFQVGLADMPTPRLRTASALLPRPHSLLTSSTSSDPPVYVEQLGLSFTQNSTALAYYVTAVAQTDRNGYGPAYLLNGLTDQGYWYQVGLSWNWPYSSGNSYNRGFNLNYEVFGPGGNTIFPANGGGGVLSFSGPVNQGDTVLLNLYFTATGQVEMLASDQNTGAQAHETYSAQAATYFTGTPNATSNSEGFFSGLMTEWWHDDPYYGDEQNVVYSLHGSGISSAWMWIEEYSPQTNQLLFSDNTPSPVTYSNPTLLQTFSSHNATDASNAYEFITGVNAALVSISPGSVALDVGQSQSFNSSVSNGTSPYMYQWYLNYTPVSGATSNGWTFASNSSGSYTVYLDVTDSAGVIAISNVVNVTVSGAPSVTVSPTSVTMDVGQSQTFNSTVSGGTLPYSYQWCLNGTAVPSANSSSWTFAPASAGSYTIYANVTDSVGVQATSNTATITVNVGTHDVAVTNVASSKTVVGQGFSASISVMVANEGSYTETFNVTAYVNITAIQTETLTLIGQNSTTLTFTWNTNGFAYGNYTISAYAWPVPGETDTANNNSTGGVVVVTIPGDVNGEGKVDMGDVVTILKAFGSTPGMPNYNPNCDIEDNGKIDMGDVVTALRNFGQHYP
jgi:hypothetical protein